MMSERQREIREAVQAANEALHHLYAAQDRLRSAGNWGIADMLGGGFLTTLIKHSRMSDAERELTEARGALRRFARELQDVDALLPTEIRCDDFLGFADYFFDGVIADWMMQSRIDEARRQVNDAIRRVEALREQLTR